MEQNQHTYREVRMETRGEQSQPGEETLLGLLSSMC